MKKLACVSAFVFALLFAASACQTSEPKLSESQEYYAGRAAAAKALTSLTLYDDAELQEYITLIGYTVAMESSRAELFEGYNFAVINDNSINAFTFPSGFVFISTGAILNAKSEDELAAIIAHEVGHVNLKHPEIATINELKKSENAKLISDIAGFAMTITNILRQSKGKEAKYSAEEIKKLSSALGNVADSFGNVINKGYDRDQELEADVVSVELLAKSGYDPNALASYLGRLGKQRSSVMGWLNEGHPSPKDRIERINKIIQERGYAPKDSSVRNARFQRYTQSLKARLQ